MKILWLLALKNILSYRKKSSAAVLAIASGFISLNLFQSYIYDVTLLFQSTYAQRNMYGDALIRKSKRFETITADEQGQVELFLRSHSDKIVGISRQLYFSGSANTGQNQFYYSGIGYDIEQGQNIRGAQWERNALYGTSLLRNSRESAVNVGEGFSRQLGCSPKKKFVVPIEKTGYHHPLTGFLCPFQNLQLSVTTHSGQVNALDVQVIGIQDGLFKEVDDRLVTIALPQAQRLLNSKDISYYSLKLEKDEPLAGLKSQFEHEIQSRFPSLILDSWKNFDIGDFYQQSISFLNLFRNFFSIIVIGIGMLSVMATFYRLVHERRKEIGILRSIGLKNAFIIKLFLIESFLLSFTGILIGFLTSLSVAGLVNQLSVSYYLGTLTQPVAFAMTMNPEVVGFSAMVTALISMTFSVLPVFKVMRLRVVDILRESN
jgi:hypothetical protein